jgi:hypothetical protein
MSCLLFKNSLKKYYENVAVSVGFYECGRCVSGESNEKKIQVSQMSFVRKGQVVNY